MHVAHAIVRAASRLISTPWSLRAPRPRIYTSDDAACTIVSAISNAVATILLLIPCFWQSRLQAGDLASHIYNAWLAQLVGSGQAKGLVIVPQTTNVLFDWLLSGLIRTAGAEAAQRISMALLVLTFVWGAWRWIRVAAGVSATYLLPILAVLAYGWVYHSGFCNFYLGLGLCFWALSLAWDGSPRRRAMAIPVFALAWLAHNLAVLWAVAVLAYNLLARRIRPERRFWLLVGWTAVLAVAHVAVRTTMHSQWYPRQILLGSGADQAWVFDDKYYLTAGVLAAGLAILLVDAFLEAGARKVLQSIPFQVWVMNVALIAIVPTAIIGYGLQAAYISDRMSLAAGVCLCAAVAPARPQAWHRYVLAAVALLFFGFLYRDERLLNAFEDQLAGAVARIPAGQRVVSAIDDPYLHVNALTHMIDRVCIGHCYSYANYEAPTGQFRLRVTGPNAFVAGNYYDSWALQNGLYVVREQDLPLYQVTLDENRQIVVRSLSAGQSGGTEYWKALP